MRANVGKIDRGLRIVVGTGLLFLWIFDPTNLLWLIGIIPLVTGAFGLCPIYQVLGLTTCKLGKNGKAA